MKQNAICLTFDDLLMEKFRYGIIGHIECTHEMIQDTLAAIRDERETQDANMIEFYKNMTVEQHIHALVDASLDITIEQVSDELHVRIERDKWKDKVYAIAEDPFWKENMAKAALCFKGMMCLDDITLICGDLLMIGLTTHYVQRED